VGQLTVNDVEVGAADAAGADPEQELARPRYRIGQRSQAQRRTGAVEQQRAHGWSVRPRKSKGKRRGSRRRVSC
jgi:hypothetical protein